MLGLVASLILLGQTVLVDWLGGFAEALEVEEAQGATDGAFAGFIAFVLDIVGSALAFRYGIACSILMLPNDFVNTDIRILLNDDIVIEYEKQIE